MGLLAASFEVRVRFVLRDRFVSRMLVATEASALTVWYVIHFSHFLSSRGRFAWPFHSFVAHLEGVGGYVVSDWDRWLGAGLISDSK